ncbi:MAG: histidinol-phosphatase HisJ family protein [Dehalobacterium sp.]|jgi:histidinol-phosphatase (PHP family)
MLASFNKKILRDVKIGVVDLLVDYHIHSVGHGERAQTPENLESFILQGIRAGMKEIGFCDHDWVAKRPDFPLLKSMQKKYPEIEIRIGIEVDHIIGRDKEIASFLENQPFDYVLGGIHHLGENNWMFDHPDYKKGYRDRDIDDLYRQYFHTVEQAVLSGFYQIIAHIDLIKVFGYRPKKPVLMLMGGLLEIIKEKSIAIELNTNGFFKPVGEIYPSFEILQQCRKMGIPVVFGSDAHQFDQVGRKIEEAAAMAYQAGYRQIATFKQKELILRDLDQLVIGSIKKVI